MKFLFIVGSLLVPFCEPAFAVIIVKHHPAHFVVSGSDDVQAGEWGWLLNEKNRICPRRFLQ